MPTWPPAYLCRGQGSRAVFNEELSQGLRMAQGPWGGGPKCSPTPLFEAQLNELSPARHSQVVRSESCPPKRMKTGEGGACGLPQGFGGFRCRL